MELVTALVAATGYVVVAWLLDRRENEEARRTERSITTVRQEGEAGPHAMDQTSNLVLCRM